MRTSSRRSVRLAVGAAVAVVATSGLSACNPLAPTVPIPKPTTSAPASSPASTVAAYEGRILVLLNAERAKAGLRPLARIGCAETFADGWAATMARTGNFSHQSMTPILRACAARRVGENIAYGNVTADAMMRMWMNSPGYRANILNPSYTHVGLGAVKTSTGRWYGVQDFVTK